MRIYYKGVLCNLATYRVMGEDRPALYPVDFSEEEIFYREFNEVHYSLWAKILSDEEYQEIVDVIMKNEYAAENVPTARGKLEEGDERKDEL